LYKERVKSKKREKRKQIEKSKDNNRVNRNGMLQFVWKGEMGGGGRN